MDIFSKNQETLSYQNEESILASNLDRVGSSDL
jgi:hypothetical protein